MKKAHESTFQILHESCFQMLMKAREKCHIWIFHNYLKEAFIAYFTYFSCIFYAYFIHILCIERTTFDQCMHDSKILYKLFKMIAKNSRQLHGDILRNMPYTVKPEITHTFGGHQFLWVITGYGFSQVYFHMFNKSWWIQNAMGYYRLWVISVWIISGLTVSQELV